jgi:hypothetical protein
MADPAAAAKAKGQAINEWRAFLESTVIFRNGSFPKREGGWMADVKVTVRTKFYSQGAGSTGTLTHPIAQKIADRIKDAKLKWAPKRRIVDRALDRVGEAP